ncbi:MAG: hypothetical protein HOC71_03220 [Candidatus Latescibacteria bacterium]|nr:hypothetical protein [Candidatus Latescibacterota bacterium]
MSEKMSPKTQEKINALCNNISVAYNLDEEIREELRCHMEDKFLGYLYGEEKLSEDDAFILVREHFGDTAVIKSLYQDVEAVAAHVSLARRIGAIWAAFAGFFIVHSVLKFSILSILKWFWSFKELKDTRYISLLYIPEISITVFSYALLIYILVKWRKNLESGLKPWFFTIKPVPFFLILILLISISFFTSNMFSVKFPHNTARIYLENVVWKVLTRRSAYIDEFHALIRIGDLLANLSLIFSSLVCIWWIESPPRRLLTITYGFFSWIGYLLVQNIFFNIFSLIYYGYPDPYQDKFTNFEMAMNISALLLRDCIYYFMIGIFAFIPYISIKAIRKFNSKQLYPDSRK